MTRGFSLLELLIALVIIATTLIAIALLTIGMPDVTANTRTHHNGLLLATSGFLGEMARGADGFPLIRSHETEGYAGLTPSIDVIGIGDGSAKMIESMVSWQTRWGLPQYAKVAGFATDYKNASEYACSPFLAGDWTAPNTEEPAGRLPPLAALTTTRTFVVAVASSTTGILDPSLFVFRNVSDTVERAASFDDATSTKTGYVAVAASGTFLYTLSAHTCPQGNACATLDTLSFSDHTLARVHTLSLPPGHSILYSNGRLYVGLRATPSDAEFLVFDISAHGQPIRIGSSEIGDSVNDIAVVGTHAYVATTDNSASGNKAIMAFDIENPYEGMQATSRSRQPGAGISQRLTHSGPLLFLGRSSPLNSKELYLFDTPDIQRPRSALDADSSIAGIVVRGLEAFVLTRTRLDRLQVANPANPQLLNSFPLPSGMSGVALACSGMDLYAAANDSAGGHLINLSGL